MTSTMNTLTRPPLSILTTVYHTLTSLVVAIMVVHLALFIMVMHSYTSWDVLPPLAIVISFISIVKLSHSLIQLRAWLLAVSKGQTKSGQVKLTESGLQEWQSNDP